MPNLREMLMAGIRDAEDADEAPKRSRRDKDYDVSILPEGQVENLKELLTIYEDMRLDGCPFRVGDIVTPRPSSTIRGSGFPHVVVEVIDPELYFSATKDQSHIHFGQRCDMRVICHVSDEAIASYWGESWQYMPWDNE
jgi:hypothetical protein